MLKENWRLISRLERAGDVALICLSFLAAYYGRSSLVFWNELYDLGLPFFGEELAPLKDYVLILFLSVLFFMIVLSFMGAYASMRLTSPIKLLTIGLVSSAIVFLLLAATLFILKVEVSRSFIGLFCLLVGLLLTLERYLVLAVLRYFRRRGRNFRNVIICGGGEQSQRLIEEIKARKELGIRIRGVGVFDQTSLEFSPIFFGKDEIERAIKEGAIDEVIFADISSSMKEVENLLVACSEQGIETTVVADLFSVGVVKSGISYFGGMPLIHFEPPPGDRWELNLKRAIDVFVSAGLLLFLSPILLLIAVGILVFSGRPILFKQKRVGLNGRIFSIYKFRTMIKDAEDKLKELADRNEMDGPVFKMKDDPRVTTIGKFLRKFSLDELPQLWNVLRGDMSLVGPRPPVPGEVSMYERKDRRRLSMRPGLTCTWQVSGRNSVKKFEDWVKMDLEYIDNWSLGRDFLLLLKTIPVVLSGKGQ